MNYLSVESVLIKNFMAQLVWKQQNKRDYLKKKKLTNKERDEAIEGLSNNDQILYNKILHIDNLLGLYLEYRKETDKFDKFVKGRIKEFEQRQRSKDKEGAWHCIYRFKR